MIWEERKEEITGRKVKDLFKKKNQERKWFNSPSSALQVFTHIVCIFEAGNGDNIGAVVYHLLIFYGARIFRAEAISGRSVITEALTTIATSFPQNKEATSLAMEGKEDIFHST